MKRNVFCLAALCASLSLSACEKGDRPAWGNASSADALLSVTLTFGTHTLTATLENNATARAFADMLPVTLPMMDLYGREMCYRFPDALPTADARTRGYEVGEIVYYPPMHSFVIMYKQNGERFRMQSVGRIEGDVSLFDGIGDIDVSFSRQTATDALTSAATNNLTIRNHGGNLVISGSDLRAALLYDIKGDLIMRTQGSSPLLLSICDRTGVFLLKLIDVAGNESCTTVRL